MGCLPRWRFHVVSQQRTIFVSVVVPVYRAERILPVLCERLSATLAAISPDYEIILVDDRSPDHSWKVLKEIVRQFPNVTAVRLSRNFGQHYALTAGLDFARGEWVVVMDCDLQDAPEEIPRLLAKASEGFDVVLARRVGRRHKWWKRMMSAAFYRVFAWLSSYPIDPSVGTFRIMRRPVVDALGQMRENFRLFGGLVRWLGFETATVDVDHQGRYEGKSSYTLHAMLQLAADGLVGFTNRPLYLSIAAGLAISCLSAAYGVYLLSCYLTQGPYGWPAGSVPLRSSLFIGGLVLFNLGLIGVYVGRIYDHTKGRPLYVVDQLLSAASTETQPSVDAKAATATWNNNH